MSCDTQVIPITPLFRPQCSKSQYFHKLRGLCLLKWHLLTNIEEVREGLNELSE